MVVENDEKNIVQSVAAIQLSCLERPNKASKDINA